VPFRNPADRRFIVDQMEPITARQERDQARQLPRVRGLANHQSVVHRHGHEEASAGPSREAAEQAQRAGVVVRADMALGEEARVKTDGAAAPRNAMNLDAGPSQFPHEAEPNWRVDAEQNEWRPDHSL
jgi:hypothetical protein